MKVKPHAIQITLKNGVHVTVGITNFSEYKTLKRKITEGNEKFVDLIEGCTVCSEDVSLIEFLTYTEKGESKNEN